MTELVIFDCDGVLIDSEGLSGEVLIGALAALGVPVDFDEFCVNWVGRSFPTVAQDIRDRFGIVLPDTFERDYRARLLAIFADRLRRTEGLQAMLDRLRVSHCVATSSSPERVCRSLEICGLTQTFGSHVFTASQVARGKPAPDLFLFVAAQMGVAPADCLVVEDSLPGVDAARAAGMDVLRYTGGSHLKGRMLKHAAAVRTFDNWADLFVERPNLTGGT